MISSPEKKNTIKLVECPRDAMQGWTNLIPTHKKIQYLNELLKVGFDSLDFGSFVSHKAIPQMADTKEVIEGLEIGDSKTRLLAIVANSRGAKEAASYRQIHDIGFPFSISETFQLRNTNSTISQSFDTVSSIQEICAAQNKRLVIYISMAFGNPYGDLWSEQFVLDYIHQILQRNVGVVSLADTVGLSTAAQVQTLTTAALREFPQIEIGVHLHSRPEQSIGKIEAAFNAGCLRFDGAIHGIGGCPMAGDELVGNMDSLKLIEYFNERGILPSLNKENLNNSIRISSEIFSKH